MEHRPATSHQTRLTLSDTSPDICPPVLGCSFSVQRNNNNIQTRGQYIYTKSWSTGWSISFLLLSLRQCCCFAAKCLYKHISWLISLGGGRKLTARPGLQAQAETAPAAEKWFNIHRKKLYSKLDFISHFCPLLTPIKIEKWLALYWEAVHRRNNNTNTG